MGNQVTNQQQQQSQEQPKQLQTRQPVKRKDRTQIKKPSWLTGKQQQQSSSSAAAVSKSSGSAVKSGSQNNGNSNSKKERQTQPPTTLVQPATDANNRSKVREDSLTKVAASNTAAVVPAELTPTPDSANRTWSDETSLPPQSTLERQLEPTVDNEENNKKPFMSGHRQRDSGISQLSTEEFERAFEELAARCALDQQQHSSPTSPEVAVDAETEIQELLVPRLRPKHSPPLRHQARGAQEAAAAALVATEEQLLLRQELLLLTPSSTADDSGRHSACSVVNDDHLFPDSVTPCKVDSGLLNDYDVPYMDDETFFVLDDWYITDDRRWSYLRRSGTPQLASWEDCQLTVSAPISPKPTPKVSRRGLFGLCFGMKSRA